MTYRRVPIIAAAALFAAAIFMTAPAAGYAQNLETQGDVVYVTGGVGLEERETLEAMAAAEGMNLKLMFAEPAGPYLAGVEVTIRNAAGDVVLTTRTTGPWVIARLPEGTYRVEAEIRELTRDVTLNVPATGRVQQVIAFPARAEAAAL